MKTHEAAQKIIKTDMTKKHIDEVQTPTVDEHFKLLLENDNVIDLEISDATIDNLPDWYDEKLYKEAQNLYSRNMTSIIVASVTGLLAIISIPGILKVLAYTKQSSTPCAAFKRYGQTILHINNLYTCDPNNPDSNWYRTINLIRWKHKTNSKRSKNASIGEISQRDMVFTQCAFVGYVLTAAEYFGMRNTPEEEEAFNHFWRVNGYMLGIPDRLNLCRKTVKETRELCQKIINDVYVNCLNQAPTQFYDLISSTLDGLWYIDVTADKDAILIFFYKLHGIKYKTFGWYSWLIYKYHNLKAHLFLVPYVGTIVKTFFNCLILVYLWFVQNWPILAWAKFGKKNSQIVLYHKHL